MTCKFFFLLAFALPLPAQDMGLALQSPGHVGVGLHDGDADLLWVEGQVGPCTRAYLQRVASGLARRPLAVRR